jgi:hypothetical protein
MNKNLSLGLVLTTLALGACTQETKTDDVGKVAASVGMMKYDNLIGSWKFVYDDARRASVEAQLAKEISDPQKLEAAKKEAEEEGDASAVEFTKDQTYISRIGKDEIFRDTFEVKPSDDGRALVTTSNSLLHRMMRAEIRIEFIDADTIAMKDPKKGDLIFRRQK